MAMSASSMAISASESCFLQFRLQDKAAVHHDPLADIQPLQDFDLIRRPGAGLALAPDEITGLILYEDDRFGTLALERRGRYGDNRVCRPNPKRDVCKRSRLEAP